MEASVALPSNLNDSPFRPIGCPKLKDSSRSEAPGAILSQTEALL